MDRIFCVLLLSVLFLGCRQGGESPREAMVLCGSVGGVSKTDALTAGDAVAVFARVEGTETYFLEAAKFTTGADGKSLAATPAVYYPESKQAVNFFAYFPYHTGTFSVPSDQSTPIALKQADLCWASASSTPVSTPISLTFEHKMARLVVSASEPIERLTVPNAYVGGTLDVATAEFSVGGDRKEVRAAGGALILPEQSLSRLVLTVSGVDYVFEQPFTLQSGQTTTLNLTFNSTTKTATLSGSSTTTHWGNAFRTDVPNQTGSNTLTLHWASYVPQGTPPDKIVLTIKDQTTNTTNEYIVSNGITYADKSFVVSLMSPLLNYPYTITKMIFYRGALQTFPPCTNFVGSTIYRSGTATVGIKDPANAILISGTWWAAGDLVANGPNNCKIGEPTQDGLVFGRGSLVGWSTPIKPLALEVTPMGYAGSTTFPGAYEASATYPATDNPTTGIGDPCRYYLGDPWHVPYWSDITSSPIWIQSVVQRTGGWSASSRGYVTHYGGLMGVATGYRMLDGASDETATRLRWRTATPAEAYGYYTTATYAVSIDNRWLGSDHRGAGLTVRCIRN